MKLCLPVEVRVLAKQAKAAKKTKAASRDAERQALEQQERLASKTKKDSEREAAQQQRLASVKRKYGIDFNDVPGPLAEVVLGDYTTTARKKPNTSLTAARQGFAIFQVACRDVEAESFRAELSFYDGPWDVNAATAALVHFYRGRGNPPAGAGSTGPSWAGTFLALQGLVRRVVVAEGARVLSFLDDQDKEEAKAALPGVLRQLVEQGDEGVLGGPLRRLLLHKALRARGVAEQDAQELMTGRATAKRMDRFADYPGHPDLSVEATAERLHDFLQTRADPATRKQRLLAEFKKWDVEFRADSAFSAAYVRGGEDMDPVEVAAVMSLTAHLFSWSHVAWSNLHVKAEGKLRGKVFAGRLSWEDAFEEASLYVDRNADRYNRHNYSDDDYDDYGDYSDYDDREFYRHGRHGRRRWW